MKKIYYILTLLLCVYVQSANAQMGVNSTGAAPATSSILDISSTTKGFLMPRMTTTQRNAIPFPATGLMIFNTTTAEIEVQRGLGWVAASRMAVPFSVTGAINGSSLSSGVINAFNSGTGPAVSGQTLGVGIGAGFFEGGPGNGVFGKSNSANGVYAESTSGTGLFATSASGIGVDAIGNTHAVRGVGNLFGVHGSVPVAGIGTYGESNGGTGVYGKTLTGGRGIWGEAVSGIGVRGQSASGIGGVFSSASGIPLAIDGVGSTNTTTSSINPLLRISMTDDNNFGWVRFENSTAARSFSQRFDLFSPTASSNSFALYYGTDQLFTVRGNGNFGLNVSNPLDLLHLTPITATGDVFARISSNTGFTGLRLDNNTGDYQLFSNEFGGLFLDYSTNNYATRTGIIAFAPNASNFEMRPAITNNVFLGTSAFRWREIWSQNALNTSSDRRLKKNINEIKYGLDEVMRLQAVSYNWKDNDDKKLQLGFIAQDVEKIVPEIVTKSGISDEEFERLEKKGEKVTDTYGMQYTGLIPVLVKAIQEQQKVIEDRSIRITQLEEKLQKMNDLEARLSLIEALMNSQKSEIRTTINDK